MIFWYDRIDFDLLVDEVEFELLVGKITSRLKRFKNKKKQNIICDEFRECGLIYLLDVWCLLVRYIYFEYVQKFVLICKGVR